MSGKAVAGFFVPFNFIQNGKDLPGLGRRPRVGPDGNGVKQDLSITAYGNNAQAVPGTGRGNNVL